ncbi:MAG: nucleotidyltransferase family protein [Trichlorobacter sp.]|jgi:predicted nucleotidyltransferase|nr:nucleotidyltransferase family protein [Trichlorobacter sp.]
MAHLIDVLHENREEIIAIADAHHAGNIRLFGSVARKKEQADSDIDLLVDFRPGSTLFDQLALVDALTNKLGRTVDVVSSRGLNPFLADKIQQELVPL